MSFIESFYKIVSEKLCCMVFQITVSLPCLRPLVYSVILYIIDYHLRLLTLDNCSKGTLDET